MKTYTCTHKAQYYETDQMGVVHHSNYIRWFEEARVEFMNAMGYTYKQMETDGIMSPVIGVEAEYRSMVHFEDTVEITAWISQFNGIKMTIEYEIRDKMSGEIRTTGLSRHCFMDMTGKLVSLKRCKPEIYELFLQQV